MRYLIVIPALMVPIMVGTGMTTMCYREPFLKTDPTQAKCLATMVYGEARGESITGKIAVAFSAINRAKNKSLCQIVLAPHQYSIFNNNPTLRKVALSSSIVPKQKNQIDNDSWDDSKLVAELAISGDLTDPTKGATHYIAPKIMAKNHYIYPRWTREYVLVATIDNHKFYKISEKHAKS